MMPVQVMFITNLSLHQAPNIFGLIKEKTILGVICGDEHKGKCLALILDFGVILYAYNYYD